jgi:hypothetical protein
MQKQNNFGIYDEKLLESAVLVGQVGPKTHPYYIPVLWVLK